MADSVPETEQVLAMDVVNLKSTRTYIERVVLQANGSYEHQWWVFPNKGTKSLTGIFVTAEYDTFSRFCSSHFLTPQRHCFLGGVKLA